MEIMSIGVHPAYWRKGHGEALAKWCIALGDMDKVPMCVSASPMGARLLKRIGFKEAEIVVIRGYEQHRESIDICFALRPVGGEQVSKLWMWFRHGIISLKWGRRSRWYSIVYSSLQKRWRMLQTGFGR